MHASDDDDPAADTFVPAAHSVHALEPVEELNDPEGHDKHAAADVEPFNALYVPALQAKQLVTEVEPADEL